MHHSFFVLFTAQTTIVFLTTFSEVYVVRPRNGQALKCPSRQYRADGVVRKIGMVARTLAIKRLVMELTQQVGTRSVLYFKDVDSKPSLSCEKPISFRRWKRIRKTRAKRMLPGCSADGLGAPKAHIHFVCLGKAPEGHLRRICALQIRRLATRLPHYFPRQSGRTPP